MLDFGISQQKASELEERMKKCGIKESDFEETFVRSQGAGGQKVNKTSTCVQLKHLPSGLIVKMQKARSQRLNRYYARKRLCEILEEKQLGAESFEARKISRIRKQKDRRRRRGANSSGHE
jgi:protein subunit release factor B